MAPHAKYHYFLSAAVITLLFLVCLGWRGTMESTHGKPAPDTPLGKWVRLYRVRPARFPIVFMDLHRHQSRDKRTWDVTVRIERRNRIDFRGHLRIGDTVGDTKFKITDIHPGGSKDSETGLTSEENAFTLTLTDGQRRIVLRQNQPEPALDGGDWYELVFFPTTPVRGLSSTIKRQPGKTFQLRYNDRRETYRLSLTATGQAQIQLLDEGSEIGKPIQIDGYRENKHVSWVQQYR